MTRTLKILARVKKNHLEGLRQKICALEVQESHLEQCLTEGEACCDRERAFGHAVPQYAFALEAYLAAYRNKRKEYMEALALLKNGIAQLREDLQDLFGEHKCYTLLQERREIEERTQHQRQENREMEDRSLARWHRCREV
ncbi:MAG: hypothetical protein LBD66_01875 [Holosporales bacterium]|jgi:flagellar export protein FliJ|nr:hypothetical protein [Holosporales bacterium]